MTIIEKAKSKKYLIPFLILAIYAASFFSLPIFISKVCKEEVSLATQLLEAVKNDNVTSASFAFGPGINIQSEEVKRTMARVAAEFSGREIKLVPRSYKSVIRKDKKTKTLISDVRLDNGEVFSCLLYLEEINDINYIQGFHITKKTNGLLSWLF